MFKPVAVRTNNDRLFQIAKKQALNDVIMMMMTINRYAKNESVILAGSCTDRA